MMDTVEVERHDLEAEGAQEQQQGGHRINRRLIGVVAGGAIIVAIAGVAGIKAAGNANQTAPLVAQPDDSTQSTRDRASTEDLRAEALPHATPAPLESSMLIVPKSQTVTQQTQAVAKNPTRYQQWAADKYLRALEAPQMVAAFHGPTNALEIAPSTTQTEEQSTGNAQGGGGSSQGAGTTLHPPASPYTVMAGGVIPALLVTGINSELPGPILAQVSENVFDSRTGRVLLVPQGSRLIGDSGSASSYGQQRLQIAWKRLIFPDTSSIDLPEMPATDQAGLPGVTDQVDNHYLATFGTAALMSLISAGQQVGQMATFGGGGTYGPYGYTQPSPFALAGQQAGAGASAQLGSIGQESMRSGMNRPATIEIRPGYQFNVMVTEDLIFPGPYQERQ
jgi:type IV secretory pathway VirB10-like protein